MATDRKNEYPAAPTQIFVGREQELEEFQQVLRSPQGQAILVVGQAGMGKTWLIEEMVARAENGTLFQGEPGLKCWAISYDIWPTDSVNRVVEQIVADATEAARWVRQKLGLTGDKKDKWRALFGAAGLIPGFGPPLEKLGELFLTFVKTPPRDTRDAFVTAMRKMSEYLSEGQRALFIVDPDKTMPVGSDHLWRSVVQELPDKIKLVFAQRPYDILVNNLEFCHLPNVVCLPRQAKQLHGLSEGAVEELADLYAQMTGQDGRTLRDAVSRYKGHAYATVAALKLLRQGMKPEELPEDPGGIAAAQWKEICKAGRGAIRLFKAYAILEVPVADEVAGAVADLDPDTYQSLVAHDYLGGLLRREDGSRSVYHAILGDHVLEQIDENEKRSYHRRAAEVYRARLHAEVKPDSLSAEQLPGHVLEAEGGPAFVTVLLDVCAEPLLRLDRLDTLMQLCKMALQFTEDGTVEYAAIMKNLGYVYWRRRDLEQVEQAYRKVVEISEKLGRREDVVGYYVSLGHVYLEREDLEQAEQVFRQALRIYEKLDDLDGMATQYQNLGLVSWKRRDLYTAREHWEKARDLYERADMPAMVHEVEGWLWGLGRDA